MFERRRFLFVDRDVGDDLSRQHDVVAAAAELDDLGFDVLADVDIKAADRTRIDLRAGQNASMPLRSTRQAALGLVDDLSDDRCVVLVRLFDLVPDLARLGVDAREDAAERRRSECFDHDLDRVADLSGSIACRQFLRPG